MFPQAQLTIEGIAVDSQVADQPMTDHETLRGALNRVQAAQHAYPKADYWVGIEGGCQPDGNAPNAPLMAFAWVAITDGSRWGKSRTGAFYLPEETAALVRSGVELGDADDRVFGISASKQKTGSVGLLTGDVVVRQTLYQQAVVLALIPFKNPALTFRME